MFEQNRADILVIGLSYRNFDIVQRTLDCLAKYKDVTDIYVLDNMSENSETVIRPHLQALCDDNTIRGFFAFADNIAANAFEMAVDSQIIPVGRYRYVVVTDLDLEVPHGWLEEHISILETCPEVFSVSAPLSMDNIPSHLLARYPAVGKTTDLYEVFPAGMHLTTIRGPDFVKFSAWRRAARAYFVDRFLEVFGSQIQGKATTQSRRHPARHLTWDLFGKDEGYYVEKNKFVGNVWRHDKYCQYAFKSKGMECRCHPLRPLAHTSLCWHTITLNNDTPYPLQVTAERVWPDGTNQGMRFIDIQPGSQSDLQLFLNGTAVVYAIQDVPEGRRSIARLDLPLGSTPETLSIALSSYFP
ncbi:glycosyltransferase family A protein [Azospirillum isscasi]|uniref:Glycosyltransferase 2-like domain-containing protein n=1 Tax=Azospirillum isscasi TaxID=3053926 RepID=A0ABU0WH38_9PROT|nr:hypothetical protein [Azospirillum isscasi]MDQ2103343.1 hypothetical protein [Azospirillum isscasi]